MYLDNIHIVNFGGFKEYNLNFDNGLNILAGPNGSGKSTILNAINVLLYSAQLSGKDYAIRSGETEARLTATFTHNDKKYKINKVISKIKSTKTTLYEEDEIICSGAKAVNDFMTSLISDIDMNIQLWYLQQEKITQFTEMLSSSNSGRFSIESILGFNKLSSLKENILRKLTILYPASEYDYTSLISAVESHKNRIKEMEDTISRTKYAPKQRIQTRQEVQRLQDLSRQIDEYIKYLDTESKLSSIVNALDSVEKEYKYSSDEYKRLEESIQNYSKHISEIFDLDINTLEDAKTKLNILKERKLHSIQQQHNLMNLKQEYSNVYKEYRTTKNIDSLLNELSNKKAAILNLINQYSSYKVLQAKSLEGNCPFCGRSLKDANIEHMIEHYKKLNSEYDNIISQLQRLTNIKIKREKLRNKLRQLYLKIREKERILNDFKVIEEDSTDIDVALKDIDELLGARKRQIHIVSEAENRLNELKSKIDIYQNILKEIKPTPAVPRDKDINFVKEQTSKDLLEAQKQLEYLDKLSAEYEFNKKQLETTESELYALEIKLEEAEKEVDFHNYCKEFSKIVSKDGNKLLKLYLSKYLFSTMNNFLSQIQMPFRIASTDNDIENVQFIARFMNGVSLPLSQLSYGQKVILSIIMAFVFYLSNNSSGILLADEPTAGLDTKNVEGMLTLLNEVHKLCKDSHIQCIMATHEYEQLSGKYKIFHLETEANTC